MPNLTSSAIKVFALGGAAFALAFIWTPALTYFLYKHKLWRKKARTKSIDGKEVPIFQKFHKEREVNVPRFGGLLIWVTATFLAIILFGFSQLDFPFAQRLNFLSRSQTWLPFFALISGSLLGLVDDALQVSLKGGRYIAGGLRLKERLAVVGLIGLIGGWWFFQKLEWSTIHIPGNGDFEIGIWYIPFFVLVMMATYSGGVIDGIDGLSGGAFASIFAAFGIIAFSQGQIDIASFCSVVLGGLLAFLWFNIPPARFYMGETGMLGLCTSLTVVAFLTDSVLVLPIVGFLLVIESGSVILQLISKRFFKKKIFKAAPIHHHFEAKGWSHPKIAMRFWIIGIVMAILGVTIRLLG